MPKVLSQISPDAFGPEATQAMALAFDRAWLSLQSAGLGREAAPAAVRDLLAKRIIEVAKRGEFDPERLREAALADLPSC